MVKKIVVWLGLATGASGAMVGEAELEPFVTRLGVQEVMAYGADVDALAIPLAAGEPTALDAALPNLATAEGGAGGYGNVFAVRGLANTQFFGAPAVTLYVDGVPLGAAFAASFDLRHAEDIQLYSGPQPSRFGRNAPAGVVFIERTSPTASRGFAMDARLAEYDAFNGEVAATAGRIAGGRLGLSAGLGWEYRDGLLRNRELGTRPDDRERWSGFARAGWDIGARTRIEWVGDFQRHRDGVQPLTPLGLPPFTLDASTDGETSLDHYSTGLSVLGNPAWGGWRLTAAFRDWEMDPFTSELSFPGLRLFNSIGQTDRRGSLEGRVESSLGESWAWRAGFFAEDSQAKGTALREFDQAFIPNERSQFTIDGAGLAAWAGGTWAFAAGWSLDAGLRLERQSREIDRREIKPEARVFQAEVDFESAQPELTLAWQPTKDGQASLRVARGFKPGGYSAFTANPQFIPHGSERSWHFEAAWSHASNEARLSWDVRGFWIEVDGYQVEREFLVSGVEGVSDYFVANAQDVRSAGLEASIDWRPADGWRLRLDAGWTDAQIQEFAQPEGADVEGNTPPFISEWTLGASARYTHPGGWYGDARLRASGKRYFGELNREAFAQGSWAEASFGLGYRAESFGLRIYVLNAFDERYRTFVSPALNSAITAEPRRFGVEWQLRF